MTLEPVNEWVIGRAIVHKRPGNIILGHKKGTTRCYLLEEVSPEARAAGYGPGDIVVAKSVYDMFFHDGTDHHVTFIYREAICHVRNAQLSEFVGLDDKPVAQQEVAA